MLRSITVATVAASLLLGAAATQATDETTGDAKPTGEVESIYDFTVKDIDGQDVDLSKYRGDVCIIVNVASK